MKKLSLIVIIGTLFTSCNLSKFNNHEDLRNNYVGETAFTEMTNMTDQAIEGNLAFYKGKMNCATITVDTTQNPKVILIDYGITDCLCMDGKTRRGAIVTTFSGPYRQTGTVITHTPQDYYVNNYKIEGTKVVINEGLNTAGNPHFSVGIDGTITRADGDQYTYTSDRTRVWINGHSTVLNSWDDEYEITGMASGTTHEGGSYTITTETPILYRIGCRWPVSGVLNIDLSSLNRDILVDYGDGNCDLSFTATFREKTYIFNY